MLEINKTHNMDALEGLKQLPDNCIDLVITDPPYNISQRKTIDRTKINCRSIKRRGSRSKELNFNFGEWDFFESREKYLDFIKQIGKELFRVAKDNCSLFMWCPKSEVSFIEQNLQGGGLEGAINIGFL